jgi:hypothetical protein
VAAKRASGKGVTAERTSYESMTGGRMACKAAADAVTGEPAWVETATAAHAEAAASTADVEATATAHMDAATSPAHVDAASAATTMESAATSAAAVRPR